MTARPYRTAFHPSFARTGAADPEPAAPPWPTPPPAPAHALPGLLSGADIQAVVNRSARTVRRWIRLGHLIPVRIGGSVFFREADIRRLIKGDLRRRIGADAAVPGDAARALE